jgi:hypothetical protein
MKPNNLIENFKKISVEAFEYDPSDNHDIYKEICIDKDVFITSKIKFINRLKIKHRAESNRIKNQDLLEEALNKLKNIISSRATSTQEKLAILIANNYPQFQYRNLDQLDDDDICEVLNEIDLIDFIEKIDNLKNANK